MEKELNIAEILKDVPKGTKLYSSACGKCELKEADDKSFKISFYSSKSGFMNGGEGTFDKNGNLYDDGECIVFPSKEMRDWEKFAWKKGDILVNDDKNVHIIFEAFENDTYTRFKGKHYLWKEGNEEDYCEEETYMLTSVFEKVNDDAVKCYINTIEERLGGKLNRETLEVEKAQPEFKDGDVIIIMPHIGDKLIYLFKAEDDEKYYGHAFLDGNIAIVNEDSYCPKDFCTARPATDEEKQELFSDLEKKNKRWNPDTKQIEDLPKKYELKPMDWCLMKDSTKYWELCQFAYTRKVHGTTIYSAVGGLIYYKCIPYNEETKHLLGTTDEWEGGE